MGEDMELEKKHHSHKKISKEDQDEEEIEEIQEQEENLNHLEHKKKSRHSQSSSKRENVDEVFRQIQDDDMKQERFTDQTVQKVVSSQQ